MDLKDMLNDGSAEDATSKSPEAKRDRPPHPPTPASYSLPSNQQTPLYPPPSASPPRHQSHPPGLTPLQTPHAPPGSQYPFPQPAGQTPASASAGAPVYRTWNNSPPAAAPFARPPGLQQHFPPAPPNANQPPGAPPNMQSHATSSLSPTPSSHRSPHSFRQSPLSSRSQAAHHPAPQHAHHHSQHSQPTTPLGPPLYYQRPAGLPDTHSPFHQRTYSGISNGAASSSPVNHPFGGAQPIASPSTYNRPPPHHRHTTDYYAARGERERSESVSPKTKVPPRPPSLGSRSSTQHEAHSRGGSVQANIPPPAGSPNHVTPPQPGVAQPTFGQPLNAASEVAHATPTPLHSVSNHSLGQNSAAPETYLSQGSSNQRPPLIHHSSSKMGMNHLLTPTAEVLPALNGSSAPMTGATTEMKPPQQQPNAQFRASPRDTGAQQTIPFSHESYATMQQPPAKPASADHPPEQQASLKRPATATSDISDEPPLKQRRKRKYTERPIWAKLSKSNPRSNQQGAKQTNGERVQHTNGVMPNPTQSELDGRPPWLLDPPLDHDLIHARKVLGSWEKTIKWNTPYPDMLKAVQDWLFVELDKLGDVGRDPREGTVEIEAKFGELKHDERRYSLPVMNATVIHPQANHTFHFESTMTVAEHHHVNQFLNKTIRDSMQPGRIKMAYKHLHETDSFHALSKHGLSALPASIQRRQGQRPPRLRLTRNDAAPGRPIIARIVKLPLSNLHIFNPGNNYDCRISINLEVNLDRADLDLDALITSASGGEDGSTNVEVDRKKDRIAYKHLNLYSIDLTKVERAGLEASHELELEVDSTVLREHMALLKEGKANAFGDVVGGFVDNATFLMRERPPIG